jgi:hypothetical protein
VPAVSADARHVSLPPDAAGPSDADASNHLARLVSYVLNPLLLSALITGLSATGPDAPPEETWAVFGLAMTFMFVMPLFYLIALLRGGRIASLSVRDRMKRRWPLIISIILMLIMIPSLLAVTRVTARPVLSVAGLFLINTVVLLGITVRFRISLHAVGIASFVSISAVLGALPEFTGPPAGTAAFVASVAALPLVAWARIRRRAHSMPEVAAGMLFGLIAPAVELGFLVVTGIL